MLFPSSQVRIPIEDIKDNLVFLKNGSVALVLSTSAVNFGLLFETEQMSIIEAFAGLLNSLSFPIQVVIRSKRLDISSYLKTLDDAAKNQTNPLLMSMIGYYRRFVEGLIKENDVLDKQFYLCLMVTPPELGLLPKSSQERGKRAQVILTPRKDHLIRQLSRAGLKAKQLETPDLVRLFYDIYNPDILPTPIQAQTVQYSLPIKPLVTQSAPTTTFPTPPQPTTVTPIRPVFQQTSPIPQPQQAQPGYPSTLPFRPSSPFVVEELIDDRRP